MNVKTNGALCGLGLSFVVACGGGAPKAESATSGNAPATFAAQAAEGQKLYGENCASCHGASGEGVKAPRVVGMQQGALPLDPPSGAKYRKSQFKTAADVAAFVVKSMPPGQAGKLTEEQYWDILAFDLKANGVELDKRLDGASAAGVVIHP